MHIYLNNNNNNHNPNNDFRLRMEMHHTSPDNKNNKQTNNQSQAQTRSGKRHNVDKEDYQAKKVHMLENPILYITSQKNLEEINSNNNVNNNINKVKT